MSTTGNEEVGGIAITSSLAAKVAEFHSAILWQARRITVNLRDELRWAKEELRGDVD